MVDALQQLNGFMSRMQNSALNVLLFLLQCVKQIFFGDDEELRGTKHQRDSDGRGGAQWFG